MLWNVLWKLCGSVIGSTIRVKPISLVPTVDAVSGEAWALRNDPALGLRVKKTAHPEIPVFFETVYSRAGSGGCSFERPLSPL